MADLFYKIILEVKSCNGIVDAFVARTINYLAASKLRVCNEITCKFWQRFFGVEKIGIVKNPCNLWLKNIT